MEAILQLRRQLAPDNGADFILAGLRAVAAEEDWAGQGLVVPSRATVNRKLAAAGVLATNPRKRPRRSYRSFSYAQPRDCYQLDGTFHALADGTQVVAIDVIDDCTRRWLAASVALRETTNAAIAALGQAVTANGAPGLVLADNGRAFTGATTNGSATTPRFPAFVSDAGSRLIHSSPYHPQTLGKCERLHQSAKKLLAHHFPTPAATPAALQTQLDHVRLTYNTRWHTVIGRTPDQAWNNAPALGGPQHLPAQTDARIWRTRADDRARFKLGKRHHIAIDNIHKGQPITVIANANHITVYNLTGTPIAQGHIDPERTYHRLKAA